MTFSVFRTAGIIFCTWAPVCALMAPCHSTKAVSNVGSAAAARALGTTGARLQHSNVTTGTRCTLFFPETVSQARVQLVIGFRFVLFIYVLPSAFYFIAFLSFFSFFLPFIIFSLPLLSDFHSFFRSPFLFILLCFICLFSFYFFMYAVYLRKYCNVGNENDVENLAD
jgi:hypothetical protein